MVAVPPLRPPHALFHWPDAFSSYVFPAGDLGDAFYVVGDGKFDILIDGVGKVAEREAGSFFGELALL